MTYGRIISLCAALGLTAGAFALTALPAFVKAAPVVLTAPASPDLVGRHISYADLNLASLEGERVLNGRVRGAVKSLCSETTGRDDGSFTVRSTIKKCDDTAWDEARPQIERAVQRAHDIALTGASTTAAVAITIAIPE